MENWLLNEQIDRENFGSGEYTNAEILKLLHEHWPSFHQNIENGHKVKSWSAEDIGSGRGFLSRVYRVVVEFDGVDEKASVVIKIPVKTINVDPKAATEGDGVDTFAVHNVECEIYELFKNDNVPAMPLVYYTERSHELKPGMLILEDLSMNYGNYKLTQSVTEEQCWELLRLIVRLQIHMSKITKKEWQGKFVENSHCSTFYDSFLGGFIPHVKTEHKDFVPFIERLNCITNPKFARYALLDRPSELNAKAFCHGDSWLNNVLFKKNADRSLSNTPSYLLDWQLVFEGNLFFDFARFLTIAADAEIRRAVQPKVVDQYYAMVEAEEKKISESSKVSHKKEELHELFDLAYLHQSTLFLIAPVFIRLAAIRDETENVIAAEEEKLKLRARLNCEDVFPLIEKYQLEDKFS
ncbi:hypothetical protein M3Y95_00139800 [Aphelenchoides besseyi]|nr:hypothetical protein M3Y95_00139800 [Aphelenchoides besseyi]